jgi:galactoside O-acetyltransferase
MSEQYNNKLLRSCGKDTFISANVEIKRPHLVTIGSHSAIDTGFYCTVQAELGDYIHIGPYATIIGGVTGLLKMGNFTNIAAGSRIVCGSDEYMGEGLIGPPTVPDKYRDRIIVEPVIFENFANIGTNVVVLPGVTLKEGCVIGASSLVTKHTEPWTIYYGIPAKPIKKRPRDKMLKAAKALGY